MLDEIETLMTGLRTVTDSVAHDLRSPLTRLKSQLELALRDGPADGPTDGQEQGQGHRAALEHAIAETDGILRTFATLMEIARAESGKAGIAMAPLDLRTIVADMVALYAPLAEEKGLRLKAALGETGEVAGHCQFLSQLVANLLDNALAYTAEGHVRVTLAREPAGAVRLTVEDSGPGIPPAERARVLQPLRPPRYEPQRRRQRPRAQPRRRRGVAPPGATGARPESARGPQGRGDLPAADHVTRPAVTAARRAYPLSSC